MEDLTLGYEKMKKSQVTAPYSSGRAIAIVTALVAVFMAFEIIYHRDVFLWSENLILYL